MDREGRTYDGNLEDAGYFFGRGILPGAGAAEAAEASNRWPSISASDAR